MMKDIDLVFRTMFSELNQRCIDASFETAFSVAGRFVPVRVKDKIYWYFDIAREGKVQRSYVGPQTDPEIARRVAEFNEIKGDFKARRKLVSVLTNQGGLPAPDRFAGDVVEALANAGLFRLRGVLVGTVAFQCYAGLLGVRLPSTSMQTGDADLAQNHGISSAVSDSLPPVLDVLRAVDPTFRDIPHQMDGRRSTSFINASRYKVEFLTPNRGGEDLAGRPADMPALGGAAAQPLRFLDFLINEPVRSVMLHKGGIAVTVPAPERYAVHKLIVASRRKHDANGVGKREKDVRQAALLAEALALTRRQVDLAAAYAEAWQRGKAWREAITTGMSFLAEADRERFRETIVAGLRDLGDEPAKYAI